MPYTTISSGLTLQVPTSGTRNWGARVKTDAWDKISAHDHTGAGKGIPIATGALADRAVTSVKLEKNIAETVAPTLTPSGTTTAPDFNNGRIQTIDLGSASGDVTATVANPVEGAIYRVFIVQGATPRDIIWAGATFRWEGGEKPILSELAEDEVCIAELVYKGAEMFGSWKLAY